MSRGLATGLSQGQEGRGAVLREVATEWQVAAGGPEGLGMTVTRMRGGSPPSMAP